MVDFITFLSPTTKQVSRTTLMRDLRTRYESGKDLLAIKLKKHIDLGGRISLTTDGWSGNNKLDYIAVTAHWSNDDFTLESTLLDIIEITDPSHNGQVLAQKLLEVTNRLNVTHSILSITRDNAAPNNTMLDAFEAEVANQWDILPEDEQLKYALKFNRVDGDQRCCAHIYNLGVQAALEAIKVVLRQYGSEYILLHNDATPQTPSPDGELQELDAFHKLRCLCLIFKIRKTPRFELKEACKKKKIKFVELAFDMPVRWNSTDRMLSAALKIAPAIKSVLRKQQWDESVKLYKTPDEADWKTLKDMALFFDLFRRPTVQIQAEQYPTLHNAIPEYLQLQRQLNVWVYDDEQPIIQIAAKAALEKMNTYYKESMATRQASVAIICDPRYKLRVLEYLHEVAGGVDAPDYKKSKAHFEHVYNAYKTRADNIAKYEDRIDREAAIRAQIEAESESDSSLSSEHSIEDESRNNPFWGYEASNPGIATIRRDEIDRWLEEGVIDRNSSPEDIRRFLLSRRDDFPIITQIALDYHAIPATSAPSERVFS